MFNQDACIFIALFKFVHCKEMVVSVADHEALAFNIINHKTKRNHSVEAESDLLVTIQSTE